MSQADISENLTPKETNKEYTKDSETAMPESNISTPTTTPGSGSVSDDTADVPARNGTKLAVEECRSVEIIDETPVNMLIRVFDDDESSNTLNKTKNARNELLYKHGLYELIYGDGNEILRLSETPYGAVSSHEDSGTFTVWVNDDPSIETPPSMEEDVLEAVKDIKEDPDIGIRPLTEIHQTILDTQVRRRVIERLLTAEPFSTVAEHGMITPTNKGWLMHDQLLLTWDGEFHNQSNEDRRYEVSGSGVRKVESVNKAFSLNNRTGQQSVASYGEDAEKTTNRTTVEFGDATHTFGKKEVEFVSRVVWALKNVKPRGLNNEAEAEAEAINNNTVN